MINDLKNIKNRLGKNPELKPIYMGMLNYFTKNKKAKELAKKRYLENCKNCEFFANEKNELLKFEDNSIKELSNKLCSLCGCNCSFKLRQSLKKCEKWRE